MGTLTESHTTELGHRIPLLHRTTFHVLSLPSPLPFPRSYGQFCASHPSGACQGISGPVAYGNSSSAHFPTSWHCSSGSLLPRIIHVPSDRQGQQAAL